MLDIKFIRENEKELKKAIKNKNLSLDLDALISLDKERVEHIQKIEELKALKNNLNNRVSAAKDDEERKKAIEEGKTIKERLSELEPELNAINEKFEEMMVQVPTIPSADTPIGKSEEDNVEIARWGEPEFKGGFKPKDHIEIGKALDIIDFERGAKVAGFRGYYLKGDGAAIVLALMMYAAEKMIKKGYPLTIPPTLVKEFALFGSGYFKGREYDPETDEIYLVGSGDREATGEKSRDKKFLVGTAEPSLLAYYSDEVIDEEKLPIKASGFSQCYRSEIGSYGKDVKGLYRVHEFMKVEQVVICRDDKKEAEMLQEEMIAISKEMHEELGLPYRQVIICTGELGPGKYRQYDLEVWLPGMNRWAETGSASIFLDWQSRRLNVKYADKSGKKKFVYMLNNTALPSPRPLIAILENYQTEDGKVRVPEVLKKYLGKDIIG